ncbi:MAG: nitroreductase family protein [Myxococcota bacterium]|jgi:nitroreductase|nr:nitroreductase family protein [Myxococcota bacterium]
MDTLKAIESRRSIKHFDPEHRLSAEEEQQILSLALLSPTAFNIQNWRFVVVKDPALRQQIRAAAWDQAQVTDASLFIILCADLRAFEKEPQRYWRTAPKPAQDFLLPAIDAYYRDKPQVQRDEAMRSCGMAAQTLMLTAQALGYGACPMDGFDFDAVGKLINLPEDHVIAMFVAIGKGTQEARPRGGQLPLNELVLTDKFL